MHFLQLVITPNLQDISTVEKEPEDRKEEDYSMIYCACEGKKNDKDKDSKNKTLKELNEEKEEEKEAQKMMANSFAEHYQDLGMTRNTTPSWLWYSQGALNLVSLFCYYSFKGSNIILD
jgi:hypothetical protein